MSNRPIVAKLSVFTEGQCDSTYLSENSLVLFDQVAKILPTLYQERREVLDPGEYWTCMVDRRRKWSTTTWILRDARVVFTVYLKYTH